MSSFFEHLPYRLRPAKSVSKLLKDAREYLGRPGYSLVSAFDTTTWRYPMRLEHFILAVPDYFMPLDPGGIPVADYGRQGPQYLPSRIAGFALGCWNISIDSPAGPRRESFMRCADWFAASPDGLFQYNFDISDLRKPWISCLGQGEGMSVLVRAFRQTGDRRYLDKAREAAAPFLKTEGEGGVVSRLAGGDRFIEEYVNSRTAHVLNGAIFGLVGLDEYLEVDPSADTRLHGLRRDVVRSIAENLEKFSLGAWSAYNMDPSFGIKNGATIYYHLLHIAQIRHMSRRFPEFPQFAHFDNVWSQGTESLAQRLSGLASKVAYRVVTGW